MEPIYTAEATATGGREGRTTSSDGVLDLPLALPKEMGGPGGQKTNPEQLFAAGYSSCFHSALTLVARSQKQKIDGSSVTADVGIGPEGESFGLAVELKVAIPGVDRDTAQSLVEKAHEVCPYSKATRGNIDVTLTVTDPV
ncbi:MAG: organic hydroperoxide resistance protein [Acidimicrobiia bacterium]|nr:organic hydroperoxide resistance protein [Acidimicrobiia bacterium]